MLTGILSVVAATAVSFAVIVLIASYYRFQHIVELAEDTDPEEMGATAIDILRVQLARYLAGCARRNTSFSLSLIRVDNLGMEVRMDSPVVEAVKRAVRHDDITCVFDGQTLALLTEAEPEDSESMLARVVDAVSADLSDLSADRLRVGIASYPGHGLSGKELLRISAESLEEADARRPIVMPEIVDPEAEDEEAEGAEGAPEGEAVAEEEVDKGSKGWKGRRKSAMLDPLTGVLKPSAVSAYMQRLMSDLRHKKKKMCLFCIGVNNMEHIARFHGEEAADDVLVGVSAVLQGNVRADDLIGRHEKHAFLILVQASLENAEIIGRRISTLVQRNEVVSGTKKIKTTITLGVAAYPEHGRNLHHLYRAGQKVLDHSRENDIRAYAVYDPEIHDSMPSKPMKSIKSVQA
jgi:diguanylate cyclase (GGDEF)-like protein